MALPHFERRRERGTEGHGRRRDHVATRKPDGTQEARPVGHGLGAEIHLRDGRARRRSIDGAAVTVIDAGNRDRVRAEVHALTHSERLDEFRAPDNAIAVAARKRYGAAAQLTTEDLERERVVLTAGVMGRCQHQGTVSLSTPMTW